MKIQIGIDPPAQKFDCLCCGECFMWDHEVYMKLDSMAGAVVRMRDGFVSRVEDGQLKFPVLVAHLTVEYKK